jgi:hypothetical protein
MESFRAPERWAWCYVDEVYFDAPAVEPEVIQVPNGQKRTA